MSSFIAKCLFLVNSLVLFITAETLPLKIISPSAGCSVRFGAIVNVTVEIPVDTIHSFNDNLIGITLNSTNSNGTFLGLLSTTQNHFSRKTGQLSCGLTVPPKGKFNSNSTAFSLVASVFSAVSHTPVTTLASVPITVIESYNSAGKSHKPIEIPKDEVNAKGHMTGDNIPRTAVPSKGAPITASNYSTGAANPPKNLTATNLPTGTNQIGGSGNNENTPTGSGATRIGISAILCVVISLSIFSSTL